MIFVRLTKVASFDPSSFYSDPSPRQYMVTRERKSDREQAASDLLGGALLVGGGALLHDPFSYAKDGVDYVTGKAAQGINKNIKNPYIRTGAHAANFAAGVTGSALTKIPRVLGTGAVLYGGAKMLRGALKGVSGLFSSDDE